MAPTPLPPCLPTRALGAPHYTGAASSEFESPATHLTVPPSSAPTNRTPAAQAIGADEYIQEEASIAQAGAIVVLSVGILLFAALGYTSYMLVSKRCSNQDLNMMIPDAKERNQRTNYEGEWDDEMWQTDSTASTMAGTGVPGAGLLDLVTGEMILENGKRVAAEIYHKIKLGAAILESPLDGSDPTLELKQPSVDYTHRPQPGGHRRPTKHLPGGRPQQQTSWSGSLQRPSPPGTHNQTSLWMDALALPEIDTDTELPPLPPVDRGLPPPTPPRRRQGALSDPDLVHRTPSKEGAVQPGPAGRFFAGCVPSLVVCGGGRGSHKA